MQKSIVLGALACAVIGMGTWFLVSGPGEPVETVTAGPRRGPAAAEREAAELASARGVTDVTAPPEVRGEVAAEEARVAVAAQAPVAGGLEVRVLGPDGAAVPGAEVLAVVGAEEAVREAFADPRKIDAMMGREAELHVADDAGVARVAPPDTGGEHPLYLVGRRERLWGSLVVDADHAADEPVELSLAVDATVRARVVGPSGAPLPGTRVNVLRRNAWGSWPAREAPTEGPEAVAVFPHVQRLFRRDDMEYALAPDALFEEGIDVALDPDDLPTDVVTLALPVSGAVEVRVFAEDGAPFDGDARVDLGIVREGEGRSLSPFQHNRRPTIDRELEDGVARFEHVELGRELEVSVYRGNARVVATRTYGRGPGLPGHTSSFDVRLGTDHPVVLLRAVDGDGRPVADTKLHVEHVARTRYNALRIPSDVRTDSVGAFRIDVDSNAGDGAEHSLIVTQRVDGEGVATASAPIDRELRDGVNDLGVVRLQPLPLFARGRVVSAAGEPLAASLVLENRVVGANHWQRDWSFGHRSGEDGAFEVRGIFPGEEFRLGAVLEGWAGELRELAPGADGLVIELQPEASLEGVVLLDPGFPRDVLRLEVRGPVEHLDWSGRRAQVTEDGSFRFEKLLPGSHDVAVTFDSHPGEVETVAGVSVPAGGTARDPRLDPLDLRGRFRAHRVSLVLPEGDRRVSGTARFGAAGAEELPLRRWFHQPEVWLVSEHASLDIELTVQGYQPASLANVSGDVEVELVRGLSVRMVLAPHVELPEPPTFIKAVLAPEEGESRTLDWGAPAFDETREITVRAPGPGRMKVVWIVERRVAMSSSARSVDLEPEQLVELQDAPGQRVEVSLTPEQVATLLGKDD